MEINKPRTTHMDPPHKTSPGKPRTCQKAKPKISTPDSTPSPNRHCLTPKERSPKLSECRPARTSAPEKRRSYTNRTHNLESEHSKLLEDLKKVKEQLSSSESRRRRAQQEVEDVRTRLFAASGLPDGDPSDPAALSSAMDDLQKLKLRLEQAETAQAETHKLRAELDDALSLVGRMRVELDRGRETEMQSEAAISAALDDLKQSREQVESLQSLVRRLREEMAAAAGRRGGGEAVKEGEAEEEKLKEERKREERERAADLEVEVRRLKVQSEQWRKAAEAATAMLSEGPPEEAEGCDAGPVRGGDGSPKKRSENMLTRIGVIWKKGLK